MRFCKIQSHKFSVFRLFLRLFLLMISLSTLRNVSASPMQGYDSPIRWYSGSLDSAKTEASRRGVPIFAVFYMSWCGPSEYLLNETFYDRDLARYVNEHTVPIALEGESEPELFRAFGVSSYPSVLIINSSGEELDRVSGAGEAPDEMLQEYRKIIEEAKTPSELQAELEVDPENYLIMYELLKKFATRQNAIQALYYNEKIERDFADFYLKIRADALQRIADLYFLVKEYDLAIRRYEFLIEAIPEADLTHAFSYLALCYHRSHRRDETFQTLERAIEKISSETGFYFQYLLLAEYENSHIATAIVLGEQGVPRVIDDQDRAYLFYLLARVYRLAGDLSKARERINQAITIDARDEYIQLRHELAM